MLMRSSLIAAALSLSFACAGDSIDDSTEESPFAVDADGSGEVDWADLDHVLACLHHPDSDLCALADVNGDGVVDDADVHDIHAGLAESGHDCGDPHHHDADGHHDADHEGDHDGTHNDDGHDDTGTHDDGAGDHSDDGHDDDGLHDGGDHLHG